MKTAFKVILGSVATFFFVIQPLRANLIASLAVRAAIPPLAQAALLEEAATVDKCNADIYNAAGDKWATAQQLTMATYAYGRGVACSPGNAILRFKYGEALYLLGFDGAFSLQEATLLEPHNPIFANERLVKARLRQ